MAARRTVGKAKAKGTPEPTPKPAPPAQQPDAPAIDSKGPMESPYARFGTAPVDPLAAMEHICAVLVAQFDQVKDELIADGRQADRKKKEKARRKEMREIARDVKASMPIVRIYRAEQAAKNDQAQMKATKAGPEMEDAPRLDGGSGRPSARRGRPRQR